MRAALLFGSVAREQATPSSDVDIAVVGEGVDVLGLSTDLSLLLRREVDVVAVSPEVSLPLLRSILRDGRVLYERAPGQAASFLAQARAVNELDTPNYERMMSRFMSRVARRGVGP